MNERAMQKPRWMRTVEEPTRVKSKKQESKIAQVLSGKVTINSGATFGQNDVITDWAEVECKTTSKNSYKLSVAEWRTIISKCNTMKIPLEIVEFQKSSLSLAVIRLDDLILLIDLANEGKK